MKKRILYTIIIISSVIISCARTESINGDIEKKQLEQTLLHTQQIFQHYTNYLNGKNDSEKLWSAKKLLVTLKNIDTVDINNNPLGLDSYFAFDTTKTKLYEVYFSSQKYGIAWTVEIDSFLSEINTNQKIIEFNDLYKRHKQEK